VASFADAVLGKSQEALQEAKDAATARPLAGEAHYALSMSLPRLVDSEPEVVRAMALSPFQSGPMIDYAVRYALLKDHANRFETPLKLIDLVLKAEPENRSAQLSRVLLLLHTGKITDAEPTLALLVRREPQSADVQGAAAVYFDLKGNPAAAHEHLQQAAALDKEHFNLDTVPSPLEFLFLTVRKLHYRGGFYLSPETLYPPKGSNNAAAQAHGRKVGRPAVAVSTR
jgi:tetratricopeptide (TPR) repeat protein